jgi:hypothetical protein
MYNHPWLGGAGLLAVVLPFTMPGRLLVALAIASGVSVLVWLAVLVRSRRQSTRVYD